MIKLPIIDEYLNDNYTYYLRYIRREDVLVSESRLARKGSGIADGYRVRLRPNVSDFIC
jgi:hypothetical protein